MCIKYLIFISSTVVFFVSDACVRKYLSFLRHVPRHMQKSQNLKYSGFCYYSLFLLFHII
jgi:hypothetical protein